MKLKFLLVVHAIIALIFGIAALAVPQQFMQVFGPTMDPAGTLMLQLSGVGFIGIGLLAWVLRNAEETGARFGVTFAFLVMAVVALVVTGLGQLATTPVMNSLGWLLVVFNLLLVVGYGYFLFFGSEPAPSGSLTQRPQH